MGHKGMTGPMEWPNDDHPLIIELIHSLQFRI